MMPNEIVDKMDEVIRKCQEFRREALKNYQRESAILRRGKDKMTPEEYRDARYDNMKSYRHETKHLCLVTIAACEAVIHELDRDNPYKASYKGGEKDAAKQGRKTNEGHGGRDPVR